jgi:hypothetical protein
MVESSEHLTRLRELINVHFDMGELRLLCVDLGVDIENLPGDTKALKALDLVEYFQRRDRLADLVEACRRSRPHVRWILPLGASLVDVVLTVRHGLEHLKLHGSPVNVAILPDLVFDFLHEIAIEGLHKRRKMEQGPLRDIGGHAGIAVKTLATLQDADDGTFDIQSIIKTGEIGRAILEEYLIQYARRRGVFAPDLSHVMTHGQSREQVFGVFGESLVRQQVSIDPGRDMRLEDLQRHPTRPLEAIERANVTGWLSTRSRVFSELMERLAVGELELSGRLFVNANVHVDGTDVDARNQAIFRRLAETRVDGISPVDLLSLGEREAITLARIGLEQASSRGLEAAASLHRSLDIPILYHTWRYVLLFQEGIATAIPTFRIDNPRLHNGAGDTFNAGVMLALAVQDGLTRCPVSPPSELTLSLESCILFGIAVVSCRLVQGQYPTQSDLLDFVLNTSGRLYAREPLPPEEAGDRTVEVFPIIDRAAYRYTDPADLLDRLSGEASLLTRLLAIDRLAMSDDGDVTAALYEQLGASNPLVVAAATRALRKVRPSNGSWIRRVVLVDLDNTLWDVPVVRAEASRWGIRQLKHEIASLDQQVVYDVDLYRQWQVCAIGDVPDEDLERLVELYDTEIYASGIIFEMMGYPNFRRLWNTPASYAVLLALSCAPASPPEPGYVDKARVLDQFRRAREEVQEIDAEIGPEGLDEEEKRRRIEAVVRGLEEEAEISALMSFLDQVAADPLLGEPIQAAVAAFDAAPVRPFADARDFLLTLDEVGDCEICGVTGGPAREEWERLKRFGLGDLIPPERLLSTHVAARPRADLEVLDQALLDLERETERLRSKKTRLEEDIALYEDLLAEQVDLDVVESRYDALREEVGEYEEQLAALETQRAPMAYVRDLFERFFYKRGRPFYARCIHAVHQGQANPRDVLNSFSPAGKVDWERGAPMKLAVVGDRYDDDLLPLIQMYGDDVCSVRVLSGRHRKKHTWEEREALDLPHPTVEVETLTQARNELIRPALWERLAPVSQPLIFEETVDEERLTHLLRAFEMTPDVMRKVAESVLDENVRNEERLEELLEALSAYLETASGDPEQRCAAISALEVVGANPLAADRVYELLLEELRRSEAPDLRREICFALARILSSEDDRSQTVASHLSSSEVKLFHKLLQFKTRATL